MITQTANNQIYNLGPVLGGNNSESKITLKFSPFNSIHCHMHLSVGYMWGKEGGWEKG